MTVSAWTEVQSAVGGALRLALGDRRGLAAFDASIDGFWRSFRAAVLCYPLYLLVLSLRVSAAQWAASGVATILLVESIAYVCSWVALPLLILPLARWLDREDRFFAFMVAYNWAQVPQGLLVAVIAFDGATGLLPPSAAQVASLLASIAVLVYEWYIARIALAVAGMQAALVVAVDLALGTVLSRVALALY